jgi:hypothetical protein
MKTIACLALLALGSACEESKPEPLPTPDAALPTPDAKPTTSGCEHVAVLCAKLNQCAPFFLKASYGDLAGCTERLTRACTEQAKSNGTGLNQASIAACATAISPATCEAVLANNVPACTFHGDFADGAVCGDSGQCASGFCNQGGNLCGVCAAKGVAGSACASGSNDECQTGLVCSSGKLCVAPAAVGGACDDATAPCLLGSFCTTGKTCGLTVAAGQECPGAYLNLGDGTVCFGKSTPANPQLAGQIGTAKTGEPCGLTPGNNLPATLCAPGSVAACDPGRDSIDLLGMPTKGTCILPREDALSCTASSICMAASQCIAGTCQIPSGRHCQ